MSARIKLFAGAVALVAMAAPAMAQDTSPWDLRERNAYVLDMQGKLVAQKDYGLTVQPFLCQSQTVSVGDVPPGSYQLTMVVYAWETGQRLTGSVPGTNTRAEELPLGTFSIRR